MKKFPKVKYPGDSATDGILAGGDEFEAVWDSDFQSEVRSNTSRKCSSVLKTMVQEF